MVLVLRRNQGKNRISLKAKFNRREPFVQKLSKFLVDNYGIICFEDLNIKNMSKNSKKWKE
jgi:transposase